MLICHLAWTWCFENATCSKEDTLILRNCGVFLWLGSLGFTLFKRSFRVHVKYGCGSNGVIHLHNGKLLSLLYYWQWDHILPLQDHHFLSISAIQLFTRLLPYGCGICGFPFVMNIIGELIFGNCVFITVINEISSRKLYIVSHG